MRSRSRLLGAFADFSRDIISPRASHRQRPLGFEARKVRNLLGVEDPHAYPWLDWIKGVLGLDQRNPSPVSGSAANLSIVDGIRELGLNPSLSDIERVCEVHTAASNVTIPDKGTCAQGIVTEQLAEALHAGATPDDITKICRFLNGNVHASNTKEASTEELFLDLDEATIGVSTFSKRAPPSELPGLGKAHA
jgi:hypothetical protein